MADGGRHHASLDAAEPAVGGRVGAVLPADIKGEEHPVEQKQLMGHEEHPFVIDGGRILQHVVADKGETADDRS